MRVLVTGARGFVGRHVLAKLTESGMDVRVLTRAPLDIPDMDVVAGDIADARVAYAAVRDVDAVVHLAARVHVMQESAADPLSEFRRANVAPTVALAEAASRGGVQTFVFASSVKAVGEATTRPWTRATVPTPVDPYGISKREAEVALQTISAGGTRAVSLRFPLLYGPGMKGNMLALMQLIDRGLPVPVSTRPNARSLLYVGNAAAAVAHLVATNAMGATDEPYFLSDGAPTTRELVREIAAALHRAARIIPVPSAPARALAIAADALLGSDRIGARLDRLFGSLEVDAGDFFREFSYTLPYSRRDGLAATASWFRSTQRTDARR